MNYTIQSLISQICSSLNDFETQLRGEITSKSAEKHLKGMIINCYCISYIDSNHSKFTKDDHDWLLCELKYGKLEWMQRNLRINNVEISNLQSISNGDSNKSGVTAYAGIGHNNISDRYLADAYSQYGVDVISPYTIINLGNGNYEIHDSLKRGNILYYEKAMLDVIEQAMGFSPNIVFSDISETNITLHVRDIDLHEDLSKHSFDIM
ncbi:MAG: hypothetical protein JXA15_13060 [Spirochaetales bacterium]|nr:hypothetical protein [Spirochaetales bacterium]